MTLAANALQAALHTRLTAQLGGTPVYDHVPQGSSLPYVVIGADNRAPSGSSPHTMRIAAMYARHSRIARSA